MPLCFVRNIFKKMYGRSYYGQTAAETRVAIFAAFSKLLAERVTARLRYRKSSIRLTLAGQHFMRILKQKTICSKHYAKNFSVTLSAARWIAPTRTDYILTETCRNLYSATYYNTCRKMKIISSHCFPVKAANSSCGISKTV